MGFEEAQSAMDSALSSGTSGTTDLAPEHSSSHESEAKTAPDVIDIGSLKSFRFKDQELTPKDLEQRLMLQRDYTKKSQEIAKEREQIASLREEQKFNDNLKADLRLIVQDPSLITKFLEVYPAKYHEYLDLLPLNTLQQIQRQQQGDQTQGQQQPSVDPKFLREFHDLKSRVMSREQQEQRIAFEADSKTKESQLDAVDARCSQKYKEADPEVVLSKLEYLVNRGTFGDPKEKGYMNRVTQAYENLWKQDHEKNMARFEAWNKERAKEQKRVNQQGRDMGAGGGIPSSAPTKIKLKDVKNHILANQGG